MEQLLSLQSEVRKQIHNSAAGGGGAAPKDISSFLHQTKEYAPPYGGRDQRYAHLSEKHFSYNALMALCVKTCHLMEPREKL